MDNDMNRPTGEVLAEAPSAPGGIQEELPISLTTVLSQKVQVMGDPKACPAHVIYSADRIRGNLIWGDACRGDTPDIEVFSNLMISGDLEDDEGDVPSTLIIPIDVVELNGGYGLIIDTDLRGFSRGIPEVRDADSGVLHALSELCKTVGFLEEKSLSLSDWSGDDFYFDLENGAFRLMLNSRNLIDAASAPTGQSAENAVADLLRRALLGSEPDLRLNALPAALRGMLASDEQSHSLQEWIAALNAPAQPDSAADNSEDESAPEEPQADGDSQDLTPVSEMLSLWEVARNGQIYYLVLKRHTTLLGCNVSPVLPAEPFTQMVYNEKRNVLGLRNLSKTEWICEYEHARANAVPGAICVLSAGMRLMPAADKELCLTLKRFVSESELIG